MKRTYLQIGDPAAEPLAAAALAAAQRSAGLDVELVQLTASAIELPRIVPVRASGASTSPSQSSPSFTTFAP